jgi:hypothetical protein
MMDWPKRSLIMALGMTSVCLAASEPPLTQVAGPRVNLQIDASRGEAEFLFKGERLMLYAFAPDQFKPYVRELHPLNGPNLLQDAPADHLHHHGLMYAVRVNGVNFWEEQGEPGVQKPIRFLKRHQGRDGRNRPWAGFTQLIHWVEGADREQADTASIALLIEERTLKLVVDEVTREVALQWESSFLTGKRSKETRLHGSDYNGLGLRLPKGWDHTAVFQNSESIPYSAAQQRDLALARWSSVTSGVDGTGSMLALFSHKTNAGGGARFFSMRNPFSYLAVTQSLDQEPLQYGPGETFELRYLLAVYPQSRERGFLDQRWERWQEPGLKAEP